MQKESNLPDEVLYALLRDGSIEAFDELFKRYYEPLCLYGGQIVSLAEAEEIVQDVMLWVWENKTKREIQPSLRGYLYRAVRNRCLTLINRTKTKYRIKALLFEEISDAMFRDDYDADELRKLIEDAIVSLPESYRVAFEKSRFEDMSYKEIAEELGVSSKTIDYRIQQALKILRVKLKDFLP